MNRLAGIGDAAGVLASALCVIHCLAMPLVLVALPALAVGEMVHQVLVGVALLAALAGLGPGYLAHRRTLVPALGAAGLACLAGAAFLVGPRYGARAETLMSLAGAALLCAAHLRNRACCHCRHG